jgi:TPP-dependent pyruvate/acetoin dehydrogenase alpha subunit
MTKDELIAFEREIADTFNAGKIRYPVHLSGGNEDALIEIFKIIARRDWVCGQWRMHYQCLLHGVPPDGLKEAILRGESIALRFPKHRVVCSAIAGGIMPIATGIALAIRRRGGTERVHCFIGDMTAEMGIAHECIKYAANHELPVNWIVEDNSVSVLTPTTEAWGRRGCVHVTRYSYRLLWPHAGAGERVMF